MSTIRKQVVVLVDPAVGFNESQLVREVAARTIEAVRDWERAAGVGHYEATDHPQFVDRIEIWIDLKRMVAAGEPTSETMERLIAECVDATRKRFPDQPVTPEIVSFMDGFVRARGWDPDLTDVLLGALMAREANGLQV